jgi:hypothetical protein
MAGLLWTGDPEMHRMKALAESLALTALVIWALVGFWPMGGKRPRDW